MISCPICGTRFDPAENGACESCPLHEGCNQICCPSCGYSTVDLEQSSLARFTSGLLSRRGRNRRRLRGRRRRTGAGILALTELPVGAQARVEGFSPGIPAIRRQQLLAYGLVPGRMLQVLQRLPVTVVQVEQTELALESELAEGVRVEVLPETAQLPELI